VRIRVPRAKEEPKRRRYRWLRRRRRRGAVLLVALILFLLVLPFLLNAPETVRRITHPLQYEETIRIVAKENGVEPALVAAVILTESGFEEGVESSKGAYGLMQILPETAQFISERSAIGSDYRFPKTNIRMGTWYLGYLQRRYDGDERLMLSAYNSGEGQVDAWIVDKGFDADRDIPFQETRDYVEKVLEARDRYTELYGQDLNQKPD
jgi:soluble lytic murein transglycosylase